MLLIYYNDGQKQWSRNKGVDTKIYTFLNSNPLVSLVNITQPSGLDSVLLLLLEDAFPNSTQPHLESPLRSQHSSHCLLHVCLPT